MQDQADAEREPALTPDFLAVLEEDEWEEQHADREEAQQGCCPLVAELLVHLHAEQGECSCFFVAIRSKISNRQFFDGGWAIATLLYMLRGKAYMQRCCAPSC